MTELTISGNVQRIAPPVGRGLPAVATCRTAGLVCVVIGGRTALGIVSGGECHAGRVAPVKMNG